MFGKAHTAHILHCLRAKASRDAKSADKDRENGGRYYAINQNRIALGLECQLIIQQIANGSRSAVDVAMVLGWTAPLVHKGSLEMLALQWLDQRFDSSQRQQPQKDSQ